MIDRIVYRAAARREFDAAAEYYNRQRLGLGREFVAEVRAVLEVIAAQPDRYPFLIRDIRHAPTNRFPFCVCYRVTSRQIVIISIYHTARDPSVWENWS